jgi:hypothetical protein
MRYVRINSHLQVTRNAVTGNDLIHQQKNQGLFAMPIGAQGKARRVDGIDLITG